MFISAFLESPMSSLKPYAKKKHMLEVKFRMEETLFTATRQRQVAYLAVSS